MPATRRAEQDEAEATSGGTVYLSAGERRDTQDWGQPPALRHTLFVRGHTMRGYEASGVYLSSAADVTEVSSEPLPTLEAELQAWERASDEAFMMVEELAE